MQIREELEVVLKTVNSVVVNLENTILRTKEVKDEKTTSLISRIVDFLRKTESVILQISSMLDTAGGNVVLLAPYTYVFRTESELVFLRSKPEHVIISINFAKSSISIKVRHGSLTITPSTMEVRARGLSFQIDFKSFDAFREKRDEIGSIMRIFEKTLYRRIVPFVEQLAKTVKK
ncbi:MAG: hypothetical protein QXR80_01825 [Desulfurococcaceae archaeon]